MHSPVNHFKLKTETVITVLIFLSLSGSVTLHNLLVRFSRNQPGHKYSTSVAVVLTEFFKLLVSLIILLYNNRWSIKRVGWIINEETINQPKFLLQTCVPSLIYAAQNNLVPIALTNLDTATFQVTIQLKIFWTTLFSRILLNRSFSSQRYFALLLLFIGEMLVHWDLNMSNTHHDEYQHTSNYTLGLCSALLTCLGSGFSGVYLELVLRNSDKSHFWIRNFQMYLCGVVINTLAVIWSHFIIDSTQFHPIFQGFNYITMWIISLYNTYYQ
ncbi:hypothetical protein CHUAL_004180 [Chamberlinius hualienensis]